MIGELDIAQMEDLLRSQIVARIGCHAGGTTYVVPVTYVYDGGSIIGHSRPGLKTQMMRTNPHVCVEIEQVENVMNWSCVIVWGRYEELRGAEAREAMTLLTDRLKDDLPEELIDFHHGPRTLENDLDTSGTRAITYRIRIERMTGRCEHGSRSAE